MITDYFFMALKNMKKEKVRAFMTLVGVTISIATILILISLSLGLEASIQEQFETLGTDKFFIMPSGQIGASGSSAAVELTEDNIKSIEKVSGVNEVTSYLLGNAKIEFKKTIKFVMILGVEPDKLEVAFGSYDIQDGRKLKESGGKELMLGYDYKYSTFLGKFVDVGDTVFVNDVGFKVAGIVEKIGNSQDDRQVYMPKDEFREVFNVTDRVDYIVVQVNDPDEINEVAERVEKKLMQVRDVDEKTVDFSIFTPEELLGAFKSILNIVTIFLSGIAAISLLVGGINIANAMFTSVLERTREIGVMKAIGAKNSDILSIFVIESGFLGLVGGISGVVFGIAAGKLIEYIAVTQLGTNLLKVVFPYYLITGCLLFGFVIGAISGLWPAWRATQIRPVEALRYE